ncbi:cytochrome c biogenesis protein CcsA [Flaviaesturariibacter aridisoli]|uniref:Cytochrome c assembly protein n=1 Tax=Flaviaesturariibacter aridisoli TaxID=2545761 RepID=A0A4R4E359_9BACT|nr:cytochrome c biogenesis protein CcsA [Flaviaesturariibacter aridisoli]TCZ73984.1 cytochrome c assembly protein [Flaviaesturariibacter aridisoli]
MDYIGEQLLPGRIGHFFVILSLVASLAATVTYFFAARRRGTPEGDQWRRLARIFFAAEAFSVLAIFGILFYIISNHLFEFKYAWQHSSRALEPKYLLSCFWEGQEGSFLLWSFWHCVLGLVLMRKGRQWEAPVMTVVSFAQVLLATMIAGIHLFGMKIGSNPFVLLRNELQAPIFSSADYLSKITDGNDLNPLLQNYWMVIHPPVLFLGFASTLIPFAYAIAGLWTREYKSWTKPALSWALFSAGVLGTGIMMGAAWAYESLNFGGYWAWDPVENASLVPWLVLVAGVHTLLIFRHTGNALRSSFLFLILTFLLILYSTYLTRSGDLQDTSVHAFTGEGIAKWHLRALVAVFMVPSLFLFIRRYKQIPHVAKEEEASSREFWMFIGSLVLLLSAITIIVMTSLPVLNKIGNLFTDKQLFKPLAMGEDSAFAYNRIQVFVAVIMGLLTAITQYFRYKSTPKALLFRKLLWPTLITLVLAGLVLGFGKINYDVYGAGFMAAIWVAVICALYAVVANAAFIWTGMNGKLRAAGGSVAHVGFGILLVGILVSSSKKEVLSHNTTGIFVPMGEGSKEKPGENLTLVQGLPTDMGAYWVTYSRDSAHPEKPLWFYALDFSSKDSSERFTLKPNAFVNYKGNSGLMANPDAKHYWNYDVFTYITSLSNDPGKPVEDTAAFKPQTLKAGDTAWYSKGFLVLEGVQSRDHIPQAGFAPTDSASVATVKVFAKTSSIYTLQPLLVTKAGEPFPVADTVTAEGLVVQLQRVSGGGYELGIKESDAVLRYITLKAYKFPFINLVWLGTLVMVAGIGMSLVRRVRLNRTPGLKI